MLLSLRKLAVPPGWIVACVLAASPCVGEEAWNRFRGQNGEGISTAASVPVEWTEKDYNWKVGVPGLGHSSPVVWGDRLYLTSADPKTGERLVLSFDVKDGRIVWRRTFPGETYRQHRDNSLASATPACDGQGVVVTWSSPDNVVLLALDREGRESWRRELGPFVGGRGSGTSPILVDDLVVLANDQEDPSQLPENVDKPELAKQAGKSFLIAVDRRTGQTRWTTPRRTGIAAYSTPCLYRPETGPAQLLFTSKPHGITAVDDRTGKVLWEVDDVFLDRCVASPVVADGLVLGGYGAGVRGTRFVAVRPGTPDGRKPEVVYELRQSVPLVPTPIAKDGRVYLCADDGVASCLEASTGKVLWRERIGGAFYSSPICVSGRLYCTAKNGEVVVLAASDEFAVLARNRLGEPCFATPAVADGVLYFRTHAHLISLGGKKP